MNAPSEGLLCLDKPSGPTSHDIVNVVRRLSGIRRVGHAGTLDPMASGLLLIGIGRATRLMEYLVGLPKRYLATVRLGEETTTYDAEGVIVARKPVQVTLESLEAALDHFRGVIEQTPPPYSAVKQSGQPSYQRARRGEQVELPARRVTVFELDLLAWQLPEARISVHCSSGTYIRAIAHDLGRLLGCGGYLAALRRTQIGDFRVDDAVPPEALAAHAWQPYLLPSDRAAAALPAVTLPDDAVQALVHGQPAPDNHIWEDAALARAYDGQHRFIGIVRAGQEQWLPVKVFWPAAER
jgi:tRNA pseudouridine55 synthase